jgi:hypothetical protein
VLFNPFIIHLPICGRYIDPENDAMHEIDVIMCFDKLVGAFMMNMEDLVTLFGFVDEINVGYFFATKGLGGYDPNLQTLQHAIYTRFSIKTL